MEQHEKDQENGEDNDIMAGREDAVTLDDLPEVEAGPEEGQRAEGLEPEDGPGGEGTGEDE
jgi:hypothetical protein